MIDIDLYNLQILESQDIDLAQISHVKEIESQNSYLKYGLILGGVLLLGLSVYILSENHRSKRRHENQYNNIL